MKDELIRMVLELPIEQQIQVIEEVWDAIVAKNGVISPQQQLEVDRRLADYRAHPSDTFEWAEVKAAALAILSVRQ